MKKINPQAVFLVIIGNIAMIHSAFHLRHLAPVVILFTLGVDLIAIGVNLWNYWNMPE